MSRVNDPAVVRSEYASEERFLARRLTSSAELTGPLVEDAAVEAAAENSPAWVLDVGCGTGDFTQRVGRELAAEVTALDLSPRMAELARRRDLHALTGDVEALPFSAASFDCVVANRVLYHLPDLDRGLAEIARVLQPGGRLVAVTYSARHLQELWGLVDRGLHDVAPFSAETGGDGLSRYFDRVERHDITGNARFATPDAVLGYFASYGEFADADVGARVGEIRTPFDATYRHDVFIASRASETS